MKIPTKMMSLVILCIAQMACTPFVLLGPRHAALGKFSRPSSEKTFESYFFGLYGKHTIDLHKICGNHNYNRVKIEHSSNDMLLTALTVGLYTPKTLSVWCS